MLKIGIIGCGSIARQRHAHEYAANQNAEIVAIFDPIIERAQALADEYGGMVYSTVNDLLEQNEVDAVSICTSNDSHAELTIAALNAGKHVLCEKPMATNMADCQAMVEAAAKSGKILMIGHNQRFTDAHLLVKKILKSGEVGEVLTFTTTFGHQGPEMWSADKGAHTWFFKKTAAAMGSMADLGIHKIDLMRWLLEDEVKTVSSTINVLDKKFPDGTPIEVDDNSVSVLNFKKGAVGVVTTSWTHYGEECNSTVLYCTKGIIKIYVNPDYSVEIVHADGHKVLYDLGGIQTNTEAQQNSSGVIDSFVSSITNDEEASVKGEDALETMKVVFACIQAAEGDETKTYINK